MEFTAVASLGHRLRHQRHPRYLRHGSGRATGLTACAAVLVAATVMAMATASAATAPAVTRPVAVPGSAGHGVKTVSYLRRTFEVPDAWPGFDPATYQVSVSGGARHGMKTVSYLGRSFEVPYGWPVFDLTTHPSTCVRFDVHAVYLGRPSGEQQCPAHGAGRRTGALLIEPDLTRSSSTSTGAGAGAAAVVLDHPIAAEIDVTAPGLTITASYGDDRATVVDALTAAGLPRPADVPAGSAPVPVPALVRDTAPVEVVRGTNQVVGLGFDTCTAPSAAQMTAWAASPFNTVGIYIGGAERACDQPSLTGDWIVARAKAGWHFMPIYVGWQAAWDTLTATASTPGPAALGTESADDAITQARALGIGPGALLYYDMESYQTAAETTAARAFLSAWTAELHSRGYRSAVYSSAATGIADLVAARGKMTEPDVVSIAQWNGIADADLTATPPDAWPAQRAHQYVGNVDASYGGVKLNIDKDYLSINSTSCPNASGSTVPEPRRRASNRLIAC